MLLACDRSMQRDDELGLGRGTRGSREVNIDGDLSKLGKRGKPNRRGTLLIDQTFLKSNMPSALVTADSSVEDTASSALVLLERFQNVDLIEDRNEGVCGVCEGSVTIGVDMLRTWDEMARKPEWKIVE